jgi:DNA-binding MarR family transcriptional regulator
MTRSHALENLGRALKGAMAANRRMRGRETLVPGDLTFAQYGLLFGLRDCAELSTGELGFLAELSPAATTEMLEGLAAAGLVERRRSERDRRVVLVSLTDRGHQLVEERRALFEPRWRAALSEFSEADLRAAAAVFDRIRDLFDQFARERSAEADEPVEVGRPLPGAAHAEAGTG